VQRYSNGVRMRHRSIELGGFGVSWAARAYITVSPENSARKANLAGLGSFNSDWIEVRMAATSYVGDHRFWRMSRQSEPSL
jgi:hypothetical protein